MPLVFYLFVTISCVQQNQMSLRFKRGNHSIWEMVFIQVGESDVWNNVRVSSKPNPISRSPGTGHHPHRTHRYRIHPLPEALVSSTFGASETNTSPGPNVESVRARSL